MGGIANRRCYFNVLFYGNLLNSNLTKWSNTLRQDNSLAVAKTIRWLLPTNCLSMFDHFVRLALKG